MTVDDRMLLFKLIAKIDSADECEDIVAVVRSKSDELTGEAINNFHIGQRVKFLTRKKNGKTLTGNVIKLNRRSVSVSEDNGKTWKVSPLLLKAIEEKVETE